MTSRERLGSVSHAVPVAVSQVRQRSCGDTLTIEDTECRGFRNSVLGLRLFCKPKNSPK